MTKLTDLIVEHFNTLGRTMPTPEEAAMWLVTEVGEVCEVLLSKEPGKWQRNHPEDKEPYTAEHLGEELGDVVYMAFVIGIIHDIDVMHDLIGKITYQLAKEGYYDELLELPSERKTKNR